MKLVVKADRLIDGMGAEPISEAAIMLEDGKITWIGSQSEFALIIQDDADEIVVNGTIMPGFVEVHSHMHCSSEIDAYRHITTESNEIFTMRAVGAVRTALVSGVTTMRDLGARNEVAFPIKKAIEDGIIPGPRMIVAGTPITTTGGHCNMFGTEADSLEEVLTAVRNQFKLGAGYIKIMSTGGGFTPGTNVRMPQYPVETLRAAVEDAERLNLRVAAHCHAASGVRNSVEAGVHNLIHCSWLSEDPDEIYDYDEDVVEKIIEKGIWVDPTIALHDLNEMRGNPSIGRPSSGHYERRIEILRDMWEKGVKFVTGMDSGMTNAGFGDFAYIPEIMVNRLQITPMEAIVCATKTSAECLGLGDETGTLEVGKAADVVVVDGNPLEDIRAMHDPNTIIANGQIIKRSGQVII